MFVDKSHKRLLDHQQLVRGVVEQGVERVTLASHSNIVVETLK